MTALDDVLASLTLTNADDIVAKIIERATAVRKTAALDDAALRTAIGQRTSDLRVAATVATTDQAAAVTAATAETAMAATVSGSTPATTLAYVTLIRDQIAAIHTTLADLQTWRAQMDDGYALATTATADLATVVATKL